MYVIISKYRNIENYPKIKPLRVNLRRTKFVMQTKTRILISNEYYGQWNAKVMLSLSFLILYKK